MRTSAQTKKLINRYMKWWVKWTGLGFHTIQTKFVDFWEGGLEADAICNAKWQYLEHEVCFNITECNKLTEYQLEVTIVHELMHIFLNEMQETGIDHEERVASSLQKAFMWVKGAKQ